MNYQPPKRRFESTGYVNPETAYYVPLENVTNADKEDMKTMVDHGRYFSMFAPRQSGKTTFFMTFSMELEKDPKYIFIIMSFENCTNYDSRTFYAYIQEEIYEQLLQRLKDIKCHQLEAVINFLNAYKLTDSASFYSFFKGLNKIITQKKIVIFIDEFDGIPDSDIEDFLTTLRKLYQKYKKSTEKALYSVGLVGIRNITQLSVGGVSPFNIADHVEIPLFTLKNVQDLYSQYTQETHQPFTKEAVQKVFEQTQGQPWLVNRMGSILAKIIKPETTDAINEDDVNKAIQMLLEEKNVHFDNIKEKVVLFKETLKTVNSQNIKYNQYDDAQSWLYQYGLIKKKDSFAVIANPIYNSICLMIIDKQIGTNNLKKKIFISYCHEDRKWLDMIVSHLSPLKHENIDVWFDDQIKPGEQWSPAIADAIQTSHMTICLISKHYLNSDFIRTRELPLIKAKQNEGMHVFPLLIINCSWKVIKWLKNMQMFPKDTIPLEDMNEKEQDNTLIEFVDHISETFDQYGSYQ
jgi:hypothetical protein